MPTYFWFSFFFFFLLEKVYRIVWLMIDPLPAVKQSVFAVMVCEVWTDRRL